MSRRIIITESQLKRIIAEAKGDNLHQFAEYITQFGKQERLSTEVKLSPDYIKENVRYIGDDIFNSQDYEDFIEERGYTWENEDEGKIEFEKLTLDKTVNDIFRMLNINERGLIYVERNIRIPQFSGNDNLLEWFSGKYNGHLGEYWSYFFGQVVDPNGKGNEISFKGWVRPEDVNWEQTINTNLIFLDEFELYLGWDTPVEIERITAVSNVTVDNKRSEFTIWNKPIVMLT